MKKKIMAAVMTAAMVAGLASTSTVFAAEDTLTVGFSQVGAESDWRTANTESMKSTFSEAVSYTHLFYLYFCDYGGSRNITGKYCEDHY